MAPRQVGSRKVDSTVTPGHPRFLRRFFECLPFQRKWLRWCHSRLDLRASYRQADQLAEMLAPRRERQYAGCRCAVRAVAGDVVREWRSWKCRWLVGNPLRAVQLD